MNFKSKIKAIAFLFNIILTCTNILFAQNNYSGTIKLTVDDTNTVNNILTTIKNIDDTIIVFTDTLINGRLNFNFSVTNIANLTGLQNPLGINVFSTPGCGDYNITAFSKSPIAQLNIFDASGKNINGNVQITQNYNGEKSLLSEGVKFKFTIIN